MIKSPTTCIRLLIVQEVQDEDGGATLRFQQGIQGCLARGGANYDTHLRLARRSQERRHPIGVNFGGGQTIVELLRADNDVATELCEDAAGAAVVFQGHDGVFRFSAGHPESARLRAVLDEAILRKERIWFLARKPELVLLDVLPAGWEATVSYTCDGNGSPPVPN